MAAEFGNYIHAIARQLHLEPAQEHKIALELEAHLEDKAAELRGQGLAQQAAMDLAVLEMGSGVALANGMYAVNSTGVWRDVLVATASHFLLAALFALHLWSNYSLVALIIIGFTLVTWKNWRAGNPSKWSYILVGLYPGRTRHILAAGVDHPGLWRLDLGHHGPSPLQRRASRATHRLPPLLHVGSLQGGFQGGAARLGFGFAHGLALSVPDILSAVPELSGRLVDRPRGTYARHRHRPGVNLSVPGRDHRCFFEDWP